MTSDEQLEKWVEGSSIHNNDKMVDVVDSKGNITKTINIAGGECCPDFSCCNPELQWSKDLRLKFKHADESTRSSMLSMALSSLLAKEGFAKMHISGDDTRRH